MFLRFKYFGKLPKGKLEENEDQMRYDAFFCYRFVLQTGRLHCLMSRLFLPIKIGFYVVVCGSKGTLLSEPNFL